MKIVVQEKDLPIPSVNEEKACAHSLLRERMFMIENVNPRQYHYLIIQRARVSNSHDS